MSVYNHIDQYRLILNKKVIPMKRIICLLLSLALMMTIAINLSACNNTSEDNLEEIAEKFCTSLITGNLEDLSESCHPYLYPLLSNSVIQRNVDSCNVNIVAKGECSQQVLREIEERYRKYADIYLSLQSGYMFECHITATGHHIIEQEDFYSKTLSVAVVEHNGKWYALTPYL